MFPFPSVQCAGGIQPNWTYNPADLAGGVSLSNGNRTLTSSGSTGGARGTLSKAAGQWYVEQRFDAAPFAASSFGVVSASASLTAGVGSDAFGLGYWISGAVIRGGTTLGTFAAYTVGDVIGMAYDATNRVAWFSKNGVWISGDPNTATGGFGIGSPGALFPIGMPSLGVASIPAPLRNAPPVGFSVL